MLQHLMKMHACLKSSMEKVTPEESQMIREGHAQAEQSYLNAPRQAGKIGGSPEAEAQLQEVFRQRQTGREVGAMPGPTGQYAAAASASSSSVKGRPVSENQRQIRGEAQKVDRVPISEERHIQLKGKVDSGSLTNDIRGRSGLEQRIRPKTTESSVLAPKPKLERAAPANPDLAMQEGSQPTSGSPENLPVAPAPTQRMHEIVEKARMQKMMSPPSTSMDQAESQAGAMGYK